MMRLRSRLTGGSACVLGFALLLAACNSAPPPPPDDSVDLEGLWLVTPQAGTDYGAGGTTTLEFGAADSGSATFLSQAYANDIKTCERHVYAALSDNVVLLDGEYYVASVAADQIVLDSGGDRVTLERVTGAAPVSPCREVDASELAILAEGVGGFSQLNAYQTRLYFNIDDPDDSLVAYDTAAGTLGAPRAYTTSVWGGRHRWVVGARSDALFYGHCGCGGSASVDHFNLDLNTSVVAVETEATLGVDLSIRYGFFDGTALVIGGSNRDTSGVNELLRVDADALSLISRRQILPRATIRGVALVDGELYALVGDSLIEVGADGMADETYKLAGVASEEPRGLTSIGATIYLLDETASGQAALYEAALP